AGWDRAARAVVGPAFGPGVGIHGGGPDGPFRTAHPVAVKLAASARVANRVRNAVMNRLRHNDTSAKSETSERTVEEKCVVRRFVRKWLEWGNCVTRQCVRSVRRSSRGPPYCDSYAAKTGQLAKVAAACSIASGDRFKVFGLYYSQSFRRHS